jgi:hypothetical protein
MILVIKTISLNKLIDGGAAMLHAEKINHHIDIVGRYINTPFDKNTLRVEIAS